MSELLFEPIAGLPSLAVAELTTLLNKTGTWRSMRPVYESKMAPCRAGCPAGEDIPAYFNLVQRGLLAQAYEVIKQDNPLPAVCGRVCYHPCEERCNRGQYDAPLSINVVERFIGDAGLSLADTRGAITATRGRVAVVGSGPAGLTCAYHLARLGYAVTIYEAASTVGGMLALGIPEYRLPRDVLRAEIAAIERLGVRIVSGVRVGPGYPLDRFFKEGCQAVFLAIGAHRAVVPRLLAERGALDAIRFLRQVNTGERVTLGRRVAVVGGGNVAVDAARCARRLGAQEVTILYRRTREEMPAHASEVEAASAEGVRFQYLVTPVSVKPYGLECLRTTLGDPDASGRRAPLPLVGSEFNVWAESVILATGQAPDSSPFAEQGLGLNGNGTFRVDARSLATSRPGVFAGGDAVTGPARVVDAIAAGKRAAYSIHRFIAGEREPAEENGRTTVAFGDLNPDYFQPSPRVEVRQLPVEDRVAGFAEVELALAEGEARAEVERCFSCGLCNGCDNCWLYCPDMAVSRQDDVYRIDYDYCKGCGICAHECPRSAIRVEEEPR